MQNIAIFKATLRLIKEGKFSLLSMAEIGYHARASATAVETIFETREELIHALGGYIFEQINGTMAKSLKGQASFDENYFRLWNGLTSFFADNPEVVSFLEQYKNIPLNTSGVQRLEDGTLQRLANFFQHAQHNAFTPSTKALIFYENVRTAAKCRGRSYDEGQAWAQLVFQGLQRMPANSQEAA